MRAILYAAVGVAMAWCSSPWATAGPAPGDVFREYRWFNADGDAGQALRVGGKLGQEHPDRGWAHDYVNAPVAIEHDVDLEHAVKAEVVIEKILCHDGTRGLAVQVNDHDWLEASEAAAIPYPQWEYQHHIYPAVAVPLSHLNRGRANSFRMRVAAEHSWKWPQNLINGVHLRVYYQPAKKPHPSGRLTSPAGGDCLGRTVELTAEADSPNGPIRSVEYIGFYDDVNLEGDGIYRQWHYYYFHAALTGHIGTAVHAPYRVAWDTSWVPDQTEPMLIAARITDAAGLTYMTEPVADLSLRRKGLGVELCRPYHVPQRWVTRRGVKQEHFDIRGDLSKARAFQLVWASWSPGYMDGLFINDKRVFDNEGPRYQYYAHRVTLTDTAALRAGPNTLATGATASDAHGMEVNWPGIMVLIQYATDE